MPTGPLLLALTTATDTCGAALWQEERVQVELELRRPRRHAERLVPLLRDALTHAGVVPGDLDAVALAAGPGSYTGLRIGASTAKGLCAATGAQLVAVSTLAALAHSAHPYAAPGDLLCPVLRSRRGEVYAAAFRVPAGARAFEDEFEETCVFEDAALKTEEAARRLQAAADETPASGVSPSGVSPSGVSWLLGSGAAHVAEALPAEVRGRFRVVEDARPAAASVARLGARHLAAGTVEHADAFEPRYLKPFHATPRRRSVFEDAA